MSQGDNFDYYAFSWGKGEIDMRQKSLQTLRMERCFQAIEGVEGNVLEVGCGEGRAIRTLKKSLNGVSTFGCDFSPHSITQTKNYRDGTSYTLSDALDLPYKEKSFDAVVVFDLIEHVTDVERVLSGINRILKDDGIFHCFVPCEIHFGTLYWFLWKTRISPDLKKFVGHIQKFDGSSIMAKLKNAGFKPVEVDYSYHFFGQIMDIILFTLIKNKPFFNVYYKLNEGGAQTPRHKTPSVASRLLEAILLRGKNFIHWLAYHESRCLKNNGLAIGFHITNRKQ